MSTTTRHYEAVLNRKGDVINICHRPSSASDPFADLPEGAAVEFVAEKQTWHERLSGLSDLLFHLPMFMVAASLFMMSATMFTLLIGTIAGWIE